MNHALMFSKASDEWSTPQPLYDALNREFHFVFDAAATSGNKKCGDYLGPDHHDPRFRDALAVSWSDAMDCFEGTRRGAAWLNPPYSKCREFIAKASRASDAGVTVVCLVPSRTDTRWWHDYVWFGSGTLRGVEVRFLKGRVKFGEGKNSAPFPSVVIIFRGSR